MAKRVERDLEIYPPSASCGYCHFSATIAGEWSVEDGRLVFRAEADPQPRRGPDLRGCCERYECGDFAGITVTNGAWDHHRLSDEHVAILRDTAHNAFLGEQCIDCPGGCGEGCKRAGW